MTKESYEGLRGAVATVEAQSSVELIVVVRPRSTSYRHIDLALGMIAAWAMVAFLLYSPWPFAWHYFLTHSAVAAIGMILLSARFPALQRGLSRRSTMDAAVSQAAMAAFVTAGAHHTQYRSGVVVYLSLVERSLKLVADSGVELAFPKEEWIALESEASTIIAEGGTAAELAKFIEDSAPHFAKHLPPDKEDRNELPDEVVQ